MAKEVKRKLLFTTLILASLLLSIACSTLINNVHAAEMTTREKALAILSDVVGLNMSAYTASLNSDLNTTMRGLPQEDTNFNLVSAQGNLRARVVFANNRLRQIYISDYAGSLSFTQPSSNVVEMAKGFLERYQSYTGNSFYGQLKSMLDGVAANTDVTKVAGNVKLDVSIVGDQVEENFVWTYVDANGVPALSKNVVVSYHNRFLESFLDNWQFYKIAGVPKLSKQEAVAAALNAIPNLSYTVYTARGDNITVTGGFKTVSIGEAALTYLNYNEETPRQSVREGDPFTLYPSWYVPLGFDKIYPGGVTGAIVRIWADTGEISTTDPMLYDGPPDNSLTAAAQNESPAIVTFLSVPFALAGGMAKLYLGRLRNNRLGTNSSWKKRISNLKIALLCALILSSPMLIMAQEVNAVSLKSEIYGSTHEQIWDEMVCAANVANDTGDYFEAAGVDTSNNFGAYLTTNSTIFSHISTDKSNYVGVMVFHWGHGACTDSTHSDYYDSDGVLIYSSNDSLPDIDDQIGSSTNHFFVWLWVCNQASHGPSSGMPHAWTQTNLISNGYTNSDNTNHCFIGFNAASPALSYGSFKYTTTLAYPFIISFYDFAVNYGSSVHDALNEASLDKFSQPYTESPLYEGYETWWPGNWGPPEGWYGGNMEVFGDSNIHLLPYSLLSDADEFEYQGGWIDNTGYIKGDSNDGNFAHIHCSNQGDMAMIEGTMDKETSGRIAIYGKSGSGYQSDLYVYVADEYPSENWQFVKSLTITNTTAQWIDIGTSPIKFRYIEVVGYDSGNSVCLYLDSMRVTP